MLDSTLLTTAIDNASKVANHSFFTTIVDKVTGFRVSQWAAEGEVRKKLIHDEYEKAKSGGIMGMQYIKYLRQNTNLIDIAVKSSKYIDPNRPNEIELDNDFFWNIIEHAKTISKEEVQELIAKIIAGEYNKPGTYSMGTLQTLKMLGKQELELFEKMCSLCVDKSMIPSEVFSIPESVRPIFKYLNIDFASLLTLQSLGLFFPNEMTRTTQQPPKENFILSYFDKKIEYKPKHETDFTIELPEFYALSYIGEQIIQHLNPKFIEEYYSWLRVNYKIANYDVI